MSKPTTTSIYQAAPVGGTAMTAAFMDFGILLTPGSWARAARRLPDNYHGLSFDQFVPR